MHNDTAEHIGISAARDKIQPSHQLQAYIEVQARTDGLECIWVDTVCRNKTNTARPGLGPHCGCLGSAQVCSAKGSVKAQVKAAFSHPLGSNLQRAILRVGLSASTPHRPPI